MSMFRSSIAWLNYNNIFSNGSTRQSMAFYANIPTIDSYEERKRRINYRKFLKNILNFPKRTWRGKRIKRNKSMFEHTHFEKYSAKTTCPNCLNYIETDVKHYKTCMTHLIATSLLPVCMCFLPYYSATFKDTVHSCPRCRIYLGTKFSKGRNFFERLKTKKSTDNDL